MEKGIIVLDIGMTNKKVAVYDERLEQKEAVYKTFEPLMMLDPVSNAELPSYNLQRIREWFSEQIRKLAEKYQIEAVSVTTHGATAVCIDKNGNVSAPCIFYNYEPGAEFQKGFYETCGDARELQKETLTPRLNAMINLAKGILFVKEHFHSAFLSTRTILNFPQYWTFLLTGKKVYEQTFLGCHTYLWNHGKKKWSSVVDKLEIREKLPESFVPTCSIAGNILPRVAKNLGLGKDVVVTAGIHDSNASLLPYLSKSEGEDFILNSTGTWCVFMHPLEQGQEAACLDDDIGKAVFFNRSALDQPVKTAIFPGGMELGFYVKLFNTLNKRNEFPRSDMEQVRKIFMQKDVFVLPEPIEGNSSNLNCGIVEKDEFYSKDEMERMMLTASMGWKLSENIFPPVLRNEERFFAALVVSMVIQTDISLRRVGIRKETSVFTEGGFARNVLYNKLAASVFRESSFYVTDIAEATALGSAMSAMLAMGKKTLSELSGYVTVNKTKIVPEEIPGYEEYKRLWLEKAQRLTR